MSLYFIAILPPTDTTQKIRAVQVEFAEKYNSSRQLKIPVHITLVPPFREDDSIEKVLYKTLSEFASQQDIFNVTTSGFGAFENKVIYVRLRDSDQMQMLYSKLRNLLKEKSRIEFPEHFEKYTPHLTVANRDLTKKAFSVAWPVFQSQPFKLSFPVAEITLLKHNGATWDVLYNFPFAKIKRELNSET